MFRSLLSLSAITVVLSCPDHDYSKHNAALGRRAADTNDWAYEASYNWGSLNSNYTLCQTGTMQSPIQLMITQGMSQNHVPTFNYPNLISGDLINWGYGPAFTLNTTSAALAAGPSVSYDDEIVYLKGWHIHAPADHSVQGDRSKAELHLVHSDINGKEKAVIAIRIDPGNSKSAFFGQFEGDVNGTAEYMVPPLRSTATVPMQMDILQAMKEVNMFNEFWTYKGSLTSPPCTEGLRWFVARNILFTSVDQMREVLRVSTYSARVEQEVWMHQINV